MNERIRQLAEQVGAVQNVLAMGRHDGVLFTETELEKFAELLLTDCLKLCDQELGAQNKRFLPVIQVFVNSFKNSVKQRYNYDKF